MRKNGETHSKTVRAGRSVGVESKVDNSRVKEEMAFCTTVHPCICSLRGRRNLTLVSDICEAAPKSLFGAPNGLNKLPEIHFIFPFNLIGKLTMAFFNRPVMVRTYILVHSRGPKTTISALFADRLHNQSLVSSVVQAIAFVVLFEILP